jgi:hypothetical protein
MKSPNYLINHMKKAILRNTHLILFSLIVATISSLIMYVYEKNTQWIYFWDNAAYWDQVYNLSLALRVGYENFYSTFIQQINTEYPTWWALPFSLIPPSYLLERSGFTIPLTAVSTIGIFIVSNLIFKFHKMKKYQSILFSTALTLSPPIWIILSSSHPDLLSIILILTGIYLGLNSKGELGLAALAIFFETAAIALRKTEAFAAAGAILFIIALYMYQILKNRKLFAVNKKTTLVVSIVGILMVPFMSPGIVSTLFRDNSEFYKSWLIEPSETVERLIATNGLIIVGFFFFSLISFLSVRKNQKRFENLWIVIIPATVFIAFVTVAPGVAPVHMAQLGVFLLVSSFISMSTFSPKKQLAIGTVAALTSILLTVQSISPFISTNLNLYPMNIQPLNRADTDQLLRIKTFLLSESVNAKKRTVYVAGTSGIINPDLVTRLVRPDFNVVPAGDVDYRDAIQWPLIFNSEFIVIPEPFQWHITNDSHNIVKVPYQVLQELKFKLKKIGNVNLEKNVQVGIYKWIEQPNLDELIFAQKILIRNLPSYSIPTVLETQYPYFQPTPGASKRIWFRVGTISSPSIIWIPAGLGYQINRLDPRCNSISGLPRNILISKGSYRVDAAKYSVTLNLHRLETEDVSCDYEITWS